MTWITEQPPQRVWQGPTKPYKESSSCETRISWKDWVPWCLVCLCQWRYDSLGLISQSNSLCKCKQSASDKNVAHLYETNEREMKAFIGLQYICGLLNWNNNDITFAYSQIYGNKISNVTMSIKRFWFLCANHHFDDISSENTRFQQWSCCYY